MIYYYYFDYLGNDYIFEALHFNVIKSVNLSSIPETIWSKPRQLQKVCIYFYSFIITMCLIV